MSAVGAVGVLGTVAALLLLAVVLAAVASIVALGRVFFEALVLFFYIGEEVFTEFAGAFDFFWIGAARVGKSIEVCTALGWKGVTNATCRYMGSSLSRPVPCSMKPELRPLI